MIKKSKKYKASVLHGVRISAETKREFYSNQKTYKEEGIKSAYALQNQKNRDAILKRAATRQARQAIENAYYNEINKWDAFGYTLEEFKEYYQKIIEWNEKIKKAEKTGKLPKNIVGKASFPISKGKINIERLEKQLKKLKSIKEIKTELAEKMTHNVKISFSNSTLEIFKRVIKLVPLDVIVAKLDEVDILRVIVESDGKTFVKSSVMYELVWGNLRMYEDVFVSILVDLLRRYGYNTSGMKLEIFGGAISHVIK